MPQAPEARRTPAIGGSSGICAGASGDTAAAFAAAAGEPVIAFPSRSILRGQWRAVERKGLDLGAAAQLLDLVADDLARDVVGHLVLALLEGRRRGVAAILELDHVPAELRVDRLLGVFALLQLERGVG